MFFGMNASGILSTPSQIKEISTLANSGAIPKPILKPPLII